MTRGVVVEGESGRLGSHVPGVVPSMQKTLLERRPPGEKDEQEKKRD